MRLRVLALMAGLVVLGACAPDHTAPNPDLDETAVAPFEVDPDLAPYLKGGVLFHGPPLRVMSFNLYVGTDIDAIFAAPPDQFEQAVQAALQEFVATDFVARSGAIADLIGESRPHVIGFQEVTTLTLQGVGPPFGDLIFDFEAILTAQLVARGLEYVQVAKVADTDVAIPIGTAGGFVRFQDFDMIMARADVDVENPEAWNFEAKLQIPFGPTTIDILRGVTEVDATVGQKTYHFVNTHLEQQNPVPAIQEAQAAELLARLADVDDPVIVVGDLNSRRSDVGPDTPYNQFVEADLVDFWRRRVPRFPDPGYTCCQASDLMNTVSLLDERIDFIWIRNTFGYLPRSLVLPGRVTVVGDEVGDKTPSGLWPSDHAGVVAKMRIPIFRRRHHWAMAETGP